MIHKQNRGIIIHLTNDNRQRIQPSKLCRVLAAMTRNNLISALWTGTNNQRICNTKQLYTFYRLGHGFIVQHLEGVVGEGVQIINRNLPYLLLLFLLSVFLGGKQVI